MQLELYINGTLADIKDESVIAITKTYEMVQNPLNYYTEFSKTIKLPLSERNNALFSNFNRQDSVVTNVTVDYTKKFPFFLLYGGDKIMEGYLRLNNVNTIMADECYEVTLYGALGLVMNTLGLLTFNPHAVGVDPQYVITSPFSDTVIDRSIVKDSFEQVSHDVDGNGILDWIGFIPTYQGMYDDFTSDKQQVLASGRVDDMTQERDEHYTREFRSYYQQPFIWVDKLWKAAKDKIEQITDYQFVLDQSWFRQDNPYYTDLIYTCPSLFNADDDYNATSVSFQPRLNIWTLNKPTRNPELNNSNSSILNLQAYTPTDLFSNNTFNPNGDLGATKFHGNFRFTLFAANDVDDYGTGYSRIRNDNPFYVEFQAVNANTNQPIYGAVKRYVLYSEESSHLGSSYEQADVGVCDRLTPDITISKTYREILDSSSPDYGTPHTFADGFFWEYDMEVDLNVQENVPYKIKINVHNYNNDKPFEYSSESWTPRWDWLWTDYFRESYQAGDRLKDRGYTVYIDLVSGYAETEELHRSLSDLSLYRVFPKDTTLRDVLLNYSKMCGLVWDVNEDDKTITVMTRNRFFQDWTVKDWSDRIDRSNDFKLEPLTFDHKYAVFNYDEGECGRLKGYEAKYQNTYGAKKIDTGYDFNVDENKLFEGLKSSVVCRKKQFSVMQNTEHYDGRGFIGYGTKVLPNEHYVDNDLEGKNAGMSGAFYFRNGTFVPDEQLSRWDSRGRYVVSITDDTEHQIQTGEYCWNICGENTVACYALPDVSTVSNGYDGKKYSVHFERPAEYYYPVDGDVRYMYNSYWKDYIDERYCSQNKKLTAYFYITPKEFSDIDFREFIKIDNILYHIDKIYDYNFNSDKPVKMDLAQVWNMSNYTDGQHKFTYLYTVPKEIEVSPSNIVDYIAVDVYCSGTWSLDTYTLPSWISAYKDGNDLKIKANTTTNITRTSYITLNYDGSDWYVRVLVRQKPPTQCFISPVKQTVVFGWESGIETVVVNTSASGLGAITVSTDKSWLSASIDEYTNGAIYDKGVLHLKVSVTANQGMYDRNGAVTLSMACGGGFTTSMVHVGQQCVSVDIGGFRPAEANGLVTENREVYDSNGNLVNSLEIGNEYHFTDIFGEEIDINSIRITNGTVNVTGNAGEQTVTFTPQLSNGDTVGGGVISVDTLNGNTVVYNYNVTSQTATPTSRYIVVTGNNGMFKVARAGMDTKTVDRFEEKVNDGTQITISAIDTGDYVYTQWISSAGATYTPKTYTFTVDPSMADADGNIILNADFVKETTPVTSTIRINANSNGYITVEDDPTHYSTFEKTVPTGTVITNITVWPNTDYDFVKWSDGSVQNNRDYTVNGDVVLTPAYGYTGTDNYFYIEDRSGNPNTVSIVKTDVSAPTVEVFSSTDQTNWTSMGTTSTTPITETIPTGGKLFFKCTADYWNGNSVSATGDHIVGGNIMSLLHGDNFHNAVFTAGLNDCAFSNLFNGDATLTSASDLMLPSNVVDYCYAGMFSGCNTLAETPVLPAKTMAEYCYSYMFGMCYAIVTAPVLPATALSDYCYSNMFLKCITLTTPPVLPAKTLAEGCYESMFQDCMLLSKAPELPAPTLETGCYYRMFGNCGSLSYVTAYANDISASDCTYEWLDAVAAEGEFHNNGLATYEQDSPNGIPQGWLVFNQ